jgi:histone acetyltransferase (RNA polymerase elongator complex component)
MPEEVDGIIRQHLSTMGGDCHIRIAFFGGSFTGMSIEEQNQYLDIAFPYVQNGTVEGIQLSTRPDYITPEILDNLKCHGVSLIELGAQSLDDEVLQAANRGHTALQVQEASAMIRQHGFELGLQMMIGLPGDTKEKAMRTAQLIADFGAACTRIYPTLVVPHTRLATDYAEGRYQPLSVEEAVDWCKDIYLFFQEKGITVLRVGLHPSEGLLSGNSYLAGPFHVSFKELVMSAIWHDKILEQLQGNPQAEAIIKVPAGEINYAVGYGGSNKKKFPNVSFLIEN